MRAGLFLLTAGLLDAILTNFGIVHGMIEEGNPMVKYIIDKSWYLFYLIKILLPAVLIAIIFLQPLKGWIKRLIKASCVIYSSVLVYHLFWIVLFVNL